MSKDYQLGYYAGTRWAWPKHRPPQPPNVIVCKLFIAALELRDQADSLCSTLCEDDEIVLKMAPAIDALDQAMMEVTKWLREGDS